MDSLINAAARSLAQGDALSALKRVSLRDDAPALALRGIAMAQLGEFDRAKVLLRRASRAFGAKEPVARARCAIAEAEIALAARDLSGSEKALAAAADVLEAHGDRANVLHARLVSIRRLLLIGRLADAEQAVGHLDLRDAPPMLAAVAELLSVDISVRTLRTRPARAALARAEKAALRARIPSLLAEVETARRALEKPAARRVARGEESVLLLHDVEALLASSAFVVDACRHMVQEAERSVPLARRPVLFALVRTLAEAWPDDAPRDTLIARAFGAVRFNDSHRARLRVEMGRLRRSLRALAELEATPRGFVLRPRRATKVVVLLRPVEDEHADVLALLADGQSWSSSAIARALGASQRTVQRALFSLELREKVRSFGRARARRWLAPPITGFTTALLLPAPLPVD
ncbi:helix-turn-helix domain-containing protein [Pendulispora albinea]|uniref:Helix-turn-helix domain-containing protein n=1 Tax=Pendulispora albinea TaxID=2741071 RepID=A0ABZ2LZ06_9BACT